jgi:hypothetical protein
MQKNVGTQEAYIRIGVGIVVLLIALFTENPTVRIILAVIAAILAGTAFLRSCPINTLIKRNTHKEESPNAERAPEEATPDTIESAPSMDATSETQEDETPEVAEPSEDDTNPHYDEEEEEKQNV